MKEVVVITGASAGVSPATARLIASKGEQIGLLARGVSDEQAHTFHPLLWLAKNRRWLTFVAIGFAGFRCGVLASRKMHEHRLAYEEAHCDVET